MMETKENAAEKPINRSSGKGKSMSKPMGKLLEKSIGKSTPTGNSIEFVEEREGIGSTNFTLLMRRGKKGRLCYVCKSNKPIDKIKEQLIKTNGEYYVVHGKFINPLELLKKMAENEWDLEYSDSVNMYYNSIEDDGYMNVLLSIRKLSERYIFRIYDSELAEKIQNVVNKIIIKNWSEALKILQTD